MPFSKQWGKPFFPVPHRFMRELVSTHEKHLRQIPQTEFVSQPAQYDLEHDVSGKLEVIEWSAGSFIRFAVTIATTEHWVTESSSAIQLLEDVGLAMRTDH